LLFLHPQRGRIRPPAEHAKAKSALPRFAERLRVYRPSNAQINGHGAGLGRTGTRIELLKTPT
jgi:hypothetical protein